MAKDWKTRNYLSYSLSIGALRGHDRFALKALFAILAGAVCLFASCQLWASAPTKRVLILFPYESNFPGFFYFDNTLRSSLKASQAYQFDFYSESMDLLRFPNEQYFDKLVDLYREKYAGQKIDLIIAILRPSLDFLEKYRDELFRGIPVLFVELDTRSLGDHASQLHAATVAGRFDMEGTLALALGLHQNVREVFVVSGTSQMDRELEGLARNAFRGFEGRVKFSYLSGLPMAELLRRISALPEDSLIFYVTFYQDANGKAFIPPQALSMISEVARAPIYGTSENFIGAGMVGAHVYSFSGLGNKTAQSALRILSGEEPGAIEPIEEKADQVIFDWRQLKRWGINEERLPPGSIIRNKEFSLWEAYRGQILGLTAVLILQALLISALVINLRKRRQANLALSKSEEQLQRAADEWKTTFNSIPDLIMVLDREFRIVRVNSAMVSFCDLPLDQILGNTCDALMQGTEKPFACSLLEKALATGSHEETEIYNEGRDAWFLVSVDPVLNGKGEILGFLHAARDITERKCAEAESHRRMTELAHVTRVATMGELASSMAHEINQPLTAILSNAQAAQRFLSAAEPDLGEVREILDDIVRDDKRVSEVIRRMRTFLKKQTVPYELFDLDEAVRECIALVNSAPLLDGLTIKAETAWDRVLVRADRVQLQQVLFNLIVNAAAAMRGAPQPSRRMVIQTTIEDDQTVRVSVTDAGAGIDEHHVDRLFEPFYTTKPEGMGMGLSISQTIIKAHGGKMGARNNPEGGATFSFTLPINREDRP